MDKTTSLYCLPIERTSASSCWTSIPRCCCNCPQMSGNSNPREQNCNKNFLKCTPWRKKSLIRSTSRWTFLGLNSCLLRLLLLFWSLSNTVGSVFSGIISAKGIPRLRLWWILLIASLFGTILLPVVSSQESVQPKPSVKSKVLPNAVVYVGSVFSYNISEDVFDCNVNSIVVSETADRFLSHWLSYSSNKKQLYGVPSDKDKGTYNILVVALTKDTSLGGHVCGSQSFSIVVMSISEQLPVSVHLSTTGFSSNDHKPALGLSCPPRIQAILGTVELNMDIQSLNGHQRMMLVVKMAGHLSVDSSKLGFFSGGISNPITQQLDNPTVIAAGVGDGRFAKGIRSFITWNMACGALKLTDVGFSKLETAAQDGTISTLMGVPVVGWHVLSGTQKDMVRRRVRRQAQGIFAITPTPSASSTPPSRLSNMSTLVIVSKTVTLKSASQNSTTLLPSVTPNRTVTKTTSVSINSTLFSQLTMKSIQSSTTGFNLTASSLLVNKSMSSSSSIHFNLTESSQPPNKTAFASSSLIFTSSSVSIYPTTSIQFPNRTIFPSYSVSINLTTSSILPNRTIILSPSVSVSLTTSSQLLSATVFKSSSAVNINTSITSILTSSKLLLTLNSSSASRPTNIVSANRTITISESHTPSLNSTFVTRTLSFILSASSPNKSTIVSSQNRSILSSLTMITLNTSQAVISSTTVPSASQGNTSIAVRASSLTASFNRSTLVTSVSISSSFPSVLTTLQSTFPATSTAKLNSSIPNVSSLTLITQATASVTVVPSSFMPVANTSLLITSAASHTSLSTVISTTSSNLSSMTSKSTFLASSSSLILLPPNTTLVENLTSSAKTSAFVTSSMVILPSTPQPGNSTESKATSPMPTSSLFTSLVSSTMNNTEISLVKTSSLVPSLSSTSSVMLSSSATQMLSPSMLLLSSTIANQTSGVQIFSSSTLQPNLTSSKTAVLPSSMSSPIVTNASEVTSVNATTTKRTAMVNSTFEINRSSFIAVTTSAFPLTRTSGTRSFPSTFFANRSVVPTITSKGIKKSSVNISSTPKITTTAFVFSTISPLSTSQFTSMFSSIDLRPNLTRITDSDFSLSVKRTTSSEVPVNSTIASSTKGSPTAVSSAVTKSMNSTLSATRTTSSAMSVVTSSSGHFNVNSSLMPSVFSSGKPIVGSSSTLMANLSSSVPVLDSSTAFSVVFTPADTSVMNLTTTEMSTTQISPTTLSSIPTSSSASSLLNSQDQTTLLSKSDVSESSRIVQNSTTLFGASRTVSMNFSSLSSTSSLRKSTTGIDSTMSRMSSAIIVVTSTVVSLPSITVIPTSVTIPPASATEILPSTTVIPTSATAIPTSVTDTLILSTHVTRGTRVVNSSSRLDSVFSRTPSSVQTSTAVTPTPVYRTTSILETSGPLPSSSSLSPSNSTQTATLPGTTRTISVSPSSTSVVIPTTAPPNSPPEVINNLGRVIAPAGVALHYTIPEDTFYDREDGADTRNLSLSMKLANGSSIPEDFWLQFDSESQTIDGLPLDTHVPDGIMGQVLVVYAQDSRGAEALDAFEVLVVPSENPVVQELNIRITNEFVEFSRNVAQRLLLLKKIASYYEDADESNIRVLSFKAGSVIMSWTNDSLPTERCDEEKLQYVANKILLSNGEVRTEFRGALKGFPVVSANEERMGVCNGSYPVITNAPIDAGARTSSEEGDLWYKHVLVGVLIVLILIVLAVLLIWYCRRRRPKPSNEKRTFKKRKPIILEPEIELKPIPGKPLVLPDDSPSFPPSYISETSLDKPVSSDEDDEEDYGKGSPGVRYEPPPPFYGVLDDEDPRNTPPPAYQLPPMF
ncbi:mucin-3A-like isoform X2 [Pocillopora damicornis]|uniref:mucin-3A-like isoform X2 n=1 Tax=Pocillopora damicornis TaxID=46731 RepID=UPI000F54E9FE|nr:mucin-3A-like isoform X2 [Pocillopora damicornis]